MNIVKLKIKNSIESSSTTNIGNNTINIKNIEKKNIFLSKLELTLILSLYRNFLKSSTELGLYFKLNAIAGNNSVIDALRVVSTRSSNCWILSTGGM